MIMLMLLSKSCTLSVLLSLLAKAELTSSLTNIVAHGRLSYHGPSAERLELYVKINAV